jgi:hypothetical protein
VFSSSTSAKLVGDQVLRRSEAQEDLPVAALPQQTMNFHSSPAQSPKCILKTAKSAASFDADD